MPSMPICSICCDKFVSNSVVQATKCGHLFHEDCIKRWLNSNSTCPECRQGSRLLNRVYLSFHDVEEDKPVLNSLTIATPQEVENLILKLSLEEAKRKAAEVLVQENARKQHQHTEMAKKQEREYQKLMASYHEVKSSLEGEKRQRRAAEEAEKCLRKELNALKQVSTKNSIQTFDLANVRRKDTANVTIRIKSSACPHHGTASSSRFAAASSTLSCISRNGLQNYEDDLDAEDFFLRYGFLN